MNGLLDVARVTYREATEDVHQLVTELNGRSGFYNPASVARLNMTHRAV